MTNPDWPAIYDDLPDDVKSDLRTRTGGLSKAGLQGVRKQAELWRNGLAALIGLLAVVGTMSGPDYFESLTAGWQAVAGLLVLLGFGLLVGAALSAMSGAFGEPVPFLLNPFTLFVEETKGVVRALRRVRSARALTVGALIALGAAAFLPYAAPHLGMTAASDDTLVTLSTDDNGTATIWCGGWVGSDGGLQLEVNEGKIVTIGFEDIESIELVDTCEASEP